tara:strand:+ start:953 stop:1885 length:933 start_codon:yes stop_codon:yes gene_type:complete
MRVRTLVISVLVFLFLLQSNVLKASIKIKYKIGDEIITNTDINNEKNYLIFLRPDLRNLSNDEILKISQNSLIREIIKKKEIKRVFKDLNNELIINEVKKKLFIFKNVSSEKEFLKLLETSNLDYEKIVEKMKYEAFWNELIFQKYNPMIKIDKEQLRINLKTKISKDKKFEYNISEILFEIEKNENLRNKYKKIIKYINSNDFKAAASRFSISNSANNGGEVGWIKETLLSENLNSILKKIDKNEITEPIKYPTGYLILRINDKKELKQKINIEKELNELVIYEKNRQLNQFSLLLFKKLKQNIKINEY